jgi:adenosine kinase
MSVLICGSLAYDTIMVYPGHFKNDILPDKVHMLNVSFLVPQMRKEFGGCAGNIAYNLALLGGAPLPMGTAGNDFAPYAKRFDELGISRAHIKELGDTYTAQAYIVTDMDDNQITAFHPGAMSQAHVQDVPRKGIKLGSVSPDGKEGMLLHARQLADADVPFLFDPGQGLPMFSGEELQRFITQSSYVAVNDYESEMLVQRSGWSLKQIADRVDALVVTRGAKGSHIVAKKKTYTIPAARAESLADPTGCGDAYRAGLLWGIAGGLDWDSAGRAGSLLGAIKIERPGTQNHTVTPEAFRARFKKEFRYELK